MKFLLFFVDFISVGGNKTVICDLNLKKRRKKNIQKKEKNISRKKIYLNINKKKFSATKNSVKSALPFEKESEIKVILLLGNKNQSQCLQHKKPISL